MQSFAELSTKFEAHFNKRIFPAAPANLYDAAQYILTIGGKRVRPVSVLMGNELLGEIEDDAWKVASAIELFHNFTLIHDDIMDNAPMRRGKPTVHQQYDANTAILAGDVMLTKAYEQLADIDEKMLKPVLALFNKTSAEVCEGQQLDMDFEKRNDVSLEEYLNMITLKTSVLLAASLQLGAVIGGASGSNQLHLYKFGRNLGIAFQIQDDYLDAFGETAKTGKQAGGDILANKKTFLNIRATELLSAKNEKWINALQSSGSDKVEKVLACYREAGVDTWARDLKNEYYEKALKNLDDVAVVSIRKKPLHDLATMLLDREN